MWNRRYRWLRRLTAGLAFAVLVVPTAQARIAEETGVAPESNAGTHQSYLGNGAWLPNGKSVGKPGATEYNGYGYVHGTGVPVGQQVKDSGIRPDDRAVRGVSGALDAPIAVRPDDRGTRVVPQPSDATIAVRPDDRGTRFSPAAGDVQAPSLVSEPSSFNWSDAGIGAGMAVGLMLLVLGAGLLTRHAGRKALAGA